MMILARYTMKYLFYVIILGLKSYVMPHPLRVVKVYYTHHVVPHSTIIAVKIHEYKTDNV